MLFNVLLAIIVDAYQGAANEGRDSISMAQDASIALNRLLYNVSAFGGMPTVSSSRLLQEVSTMIKEARWAKALSCA